MTEEKQEQLKQKALKLFNNDSYYAQVYYSGLLEGYELAEKELKKEKLEDN